MRKILVALVYLGIESMTASFQAAGKVAVAKSMSQIITNVIKDALLTFFFGVLILGTLGMAGYFGISFLRLVSEDVFRFDPKLQYAAAAGFFFLLTGALFAAYKKRKSPNLISSRY